MHCSNGGAHAHQWLSAVAGATLAEYERATYMEGVWMINIYNQTGKQGPARLTLHDEDKQKLDDYVSFMRPGCDPLKEHVKIFSLPGGRPLVNAGKLTRGIEKHYNLTLPISKRLRKELSTKAALECSSGLSR